MPRLVDFPGCCTAKILTGFGETDTADWAYRPEAGMTFEDMLAEVEGMLQVQQNGGRVALIFATTNSDQKMGEKLLETVGFKRTPEVTKNQHSDKTVTGWWLDMGNAEYRAKKAPKASAGWKAVEEKPVETAIFWPVPEAPPPIRRFIDRNLQDLWESLVVPEPCREKILSILNEDGAPNVPGDFSYRKAGRWMQQKERQHEKDLFRQGDRVCVMSRAAGNEGGWFNAWISEMDRLIGRTGKVMNSTREGVLVQFEDRPVWNSYHFPSFVLRCYFN